MCIRDRYQRRVHGRNFYQRTQRFQTLCIDCDLLRETTENKLSEQMDLEKAFASIKGQLPPDILKNPEDRAKLVSVFRREVKPEVKKVMSLWLMQARASILHREERDNTLVRFRTASVKASMASRTVTSLGMPAVGSPNQSPAIGEVRQRGHSPGDPSYQ
eukprot:TRINITY_DN4365_c0_g2_i2.p1 TRINITY_DN4365_c0_g2~~TRINITY_DN4365_c0_g2_i2.p1  ORF type:complete len:176 (+),score=42.32 TRINITY_DN4365_c0_g2_i2:49-528(+)